MTSRRHDERLPDREFLSELTEATEDIARLFDGAITFAEFVDAYGNYFHAAALDGHEGTVPAELDALVPGVIRLHADVQHLLDRLHPPIAPTPDPYPWDATRLDEAEAETAIGSLSAVHDAPEIVQLLGDQLALNGSPLAKNDFDVR